jgi:hypothetical protein
MNERVLRVALFESGERLRRLFLLIAESQGTCGIDKRDFSFIQLECLFDGLIRIEASIDHPAGTRGAEQTAGLGVLLVDAGRLVGRA